MATNNTNAKTEKPLLLFLYYNNFCNKDDKIVIKEAIQHNNIKILSVSMILERCIEHVNLNITHTSENGFDFSDDSDAKFGTVTYYTYRDPKCTVWCDGKFGGIRLVVYEPETSIFYFFCVPRDKYKKTIDVEFNFNGTPKRLSLKNKKINKIWLHEVYSFEEMANFKF
jgi:hypothetical protein